VLAAFEDLAAQLAASPDAPEALAALRGTLHRVRGTAGSYGFAEASQLAAALEERAARWAEDPRLDVDRRSILVLDFVAGLRAAFEPNGC
jgi:chemotaxis protein histidine kinase CheA